MYEWRENENGEYSYVEIEDDFDGENFDEDTEYEEEKTGILSKILLPAIVSLIISVISIVVFALFFMPNSKYTIVNRMTKGSLAPIVTDEESGFRGMGERMSDSIVLIPAQSSDGFFYNSTTVSGGSGVIVSEDGYILTSCAAISGSDGVDVYLSDGTIHNAKLVGSDRTNDCAILKINKTGLTPVGFADTDGIVSGTTVAAIGRILNEQLGTTMTLGTISGGAGKVKLTGGNTISLLQTTAATDNSTGSILVGSDGKVVGMVTTMYSSNVKGIHFAVPANTIVQFFESVTNTSSSGLVIGIMGVDNPSGVVVDSVREGSAADKGGLKKGDLILKADGTAVKTVNELNKLRDKHKKGDTMTLSVYRDGESLEIKIIL